MIAATDVILLNKDDHLIVNFGGGQPLLYCDSVAFQTQSLRFRPEDEHWAAQHRDKLHALPKDLAAWGLTSYGSITKIARRFPTTAYRDKLVKEFQGRFGLQLNPNWALIVRNGKLRLSNGKAEIQHDCYGVNLRVAKRVLPYKGTEIAFADSRWDQMVIPMPEIMAMCESQLGRFVDPLAWRTHSNFGKKTVEVLVIRRE